LLIKRNKLRTRSRKQKKLKKELMILLMRMTRVLKSSRNPKIELKSLKIKPKLKKILS